MVFSRGLSTRWRPSVFWKLELLSHTCTMKNNNTTKHRFNTNSFVTKNITKLCERIIFFVKKFEIKQVFIYWYSVCQSIWMWNLTVFSGKVDKWSNASLTLHKTVNYTVYTKHCCRSSCSSNNWNDDNNAQHQFIYANLHYILKIFCNEHLLF